jgi:hypothetical protein
MMVNDGYHVEIESLKFRKKKTWEKRELSQRLISWISEKNSGFPGSKPGEGAKNLVQLENSMIFYEKWWIFSG